MSKTKILHITHAYYNKGGIEEHVRDLSAGLHAEFDNYILTPVQTNKLQHYQLLKNCTLKHTYPGNYISWPVSSIKDNLAVHALQSAVQTCTPDVIHIHHLQNWPLEILHQICKFEIPTIFTIHDYFLATPLFTMEFSEHPRELLTKEYSEKIFGTDISEYLKLRREFFTSSLNKIKALITPSVSARQEIIKIFPSEYTVIPHGITPFYKEKRDKGESITFGYIGSIIRQKGWRTLIDAFISAAKKRNMISLRISGAGYESSEIPVHEKIEYVGPYTKKDIPQLLSHIHVGIIPSIFKETFCYTKAEMQQAELPLIVSRIGALPEGIDSDSGLIFSPGNIEELENKIIECVDTFHTRTWNIPSPRTLADMCADYKQLYLSL